MDLRQAYKGCNPDHTTILVAHQPKAAKYALDSNYGIDLVLAGNFYPKNWQLVFRYCFKPLAEKK